MIMQLIVGFMILGLGLYRGLFSPKKFIKDEGGTPAGKSMCYGLIIMAWSLLVCVVSFILLAVNPYSDANYLGYIGCVFFILGGIVTIISMICMASGNNEEER